MGDERSWETVTNEGNESIVPYKIRTRFTKIRCGLGYQIKIRDKLSSLLIILMWRSSKSCFYIDTFQEINSILKYFFGAVDDITIKRGPIII